MHRCTGILRTLASLALVSLGAGCGKDATPPQGGKPDLDMASGIDTDMANVGGNTGDTCLLNTDCMGLFPSCVREDSQGRSWPGGYCVSKCNPQKNDADGFNGACPGGTGTCTGSGVDGRCRTACTAKIGALPCERMGYSCWTNGCEPTAFSECDPSKKGSCPEDGGVLLPATTDGGMKGYSGRVCGRYGDDDVGLCRNGCDVFTQICLVAMGSKPLGCYASHDTGEGSCSDVVGGGGDGETCRYLNSCAPGLACHGEAEATRCRKFCRTGAQPRSCPIGQKCGDLGPKVKSDLVGVCGL